MSRRRSEIPPTTHWSFAAEAELAAFTLCWETDETTVLDRVGGLYRLDRDGRLLAATRLRGAATCLAASHDGSAAAIVHGGTVTVLDAMLRVRGRLECESDVVSLAFSPFGDALTVSLASGVLRIVLLDGSQPRQVVEWVAPRPKDFVAMLPGRDRIVTVAEHDGLTTYDSRGSMLWEDRLRANCGGMAASGDGGLIVLAAFTRGLLIYDASGKRQGAFLLDESPSRVAVDHAGSTIVAGTVEQTIVRLTRKGSVRWSTEVEDEVVGLAVDGLGRSVVVGTADGRLRRITWTDMGGHGDSDELSF
ncbi:MAG: hypothetical protein AAF532_11070 [Planctomycetota bacterium]